MRLRSLGRTGLKVSDLCLGAMNFGNTRFGVDEAVSRDVIAAFLDKGGNFIDTADAYTGGVSEEIVGRALKGRRDSVVIATKGFFPVTPNFGDAPAHPNALGSSRSHLVAALDASLQRLGTDHVDLFQVHSWDEQTPLEETLSTLDTLVCSGKTRYVGLSNYGAWHVAEAAGICERRGWETFATAQMQYSLICRDIELDVIPACRRHGLGILPWSPLGQGVLTGKYAGAASPASSRFGGEPPNASAAAWRANFLNERTQRIVDVVSDVARRAESTPTAVSLAWLMARPQVSSVIIGPKTVTQLEQNLAACDVALLPEATSALDAASSPLPRYPESFFGNGPRSR